MIDFENRNYIPLAEPDPARLYLGHIVLATRNGGFFDNQPVMAACLASEAPEDVKQGRLGVTPNETLLFEFEIEADEELARWLTAGLALKALAQTSIGIRNVSFDHGYVVPFNQAVIGNIQGESLEKIYEDSLAYSLSDATLLHQIYDPTALGSVTQLRPRQPAPEPLHPHIGAAA